MCYLRQTATVTLCGSETGAGKDERWLDLRWVDFIQEMLARSSVSVREVALHYQDHREHVHMQQYWVLYYMIFSHWSWHFCLFIFHGQKKVILHWGVDWIKLEGWWYHFYCSHSTTNLYFFFTEAALNHCRWTDHQKPLEGKHPEHRGGHVNLVVNKHQQQQVLLACEFWPPCISAVQKNKLSQALETLYLLTRDKVQNLGLPRRKKCSLSPAPHLLNRALSTAASN